MRKQIFAIIFALFISVVIIASETNAQSTQAIKVDVPFAFSANNKTLPAGTYLVNPATDNRVVWSIQGPYQKTQAILMVGSLSVAKEPGDVRLTFRRYGDRHFLIGFKTSSYQIGLATSGSEKDFRRSQSNVAKYDVISIETVSKSADKTSSIAP